MKVIRMPESLFDVVEEPKNGMEMDYVRISLNPVFVISIYGNVIEIPLFI